MLTFQLSTEDLTATVQHDGSLNSDLLDDLARRCVRMFAEANETLPEEAEGDG